MPREREVDSCFFMTTEPVNRLHFPCKVKQELDRFVLVSDSWVLAYFKLQKKNCAYLKL